MIEIPGKYCTAKVYTDNVEEAALKQIMNLMNQPFAAGSNCAIMPDCHAGVGCVIGLTAKITDKVVPNLVGVDIGCLDKDTEFLTPTGWKRISEYANDQVLVYDPHTDEAFFEYPNAFIKNPCKEFYHFHNSKNLDQMFSSEHRMLVYTGYKARGYQLSEIHADEFYAKTSKMVKCDYYQAKTTFKAKLSGVSFSDELIRVFVMVSADGRIKSLASGDTYTELHFRKPRKIERAENLLSAAGIKYSKYAQQDGTVVVAFTSGIINTKDLRQFFMASYEQLRIICDEVVHWDGTVDAERGHIMYSSTVKENADLVQYAFTATGIRSTIYAYDSGKENWNINYMVIPTKNAYVSYKDAEIVPSADGFKYCFNTSTGAFVIRRNDKISVTGNCGMLVLKVDKSFVFDLKQVDKIWHRDIPSGMNHRKSKHKYADKADLENMIAPVNVDKLKLSIGTLGGGNHFGEINVDDAGNHYIVIHSGSRHLGIEVCRYYQDLAIKYHRNDRAAMQDAIKQLKKAGREREIEETLQKMNADRPAIPNELAYLEGALMEDYLHDMRIAQEFAIWNHEAMMDVLVDGLGIKGKQVLDKFCTVHNYIDLDFRVLRKGSISLQKDEQAIIPMNMRDGSLIVRGKGNSDWNCSGPHGAGRLMSRSKAKETLRMEDFKASMEGIYTTCVSTGTIDESPMAYKPFDEIMRNIEPTADIVERIRPIYNFKASEG